MILSERFLQSRTALEEMECIREERRHKRKGKLYICSREEGKQRPGKNFVFVFEKIKKSWKSREQNDLGKTGP